MNRIPVIFDCDTGVDDAVAILALLRTPAFDVRGITCVAGNCRLNRSVINTLHVLEVAGVDMPVYPGCDRPLFSDKLGVTAEHVHGVSGMGEMVFDDPKRAPETKEACDFIYEEAVRQKGELELIAVAPLTNLAKAFVKYGDLKNLIKRIVIMGGAASYGNITAAAEFNIYVDPEAADIVFMSGVPVHMVGLDVTHKCWIADAELDELAKVNAQGAFCRDVLAGECRQARRQGLPGGCMHDPAAVIYAAYPELFKTDSVGVRVETKGSITRGKTVTDFLSDKQFGFKNTEIVYDVDREAFRDRLFGLIGSY